MQLALPPEADYLGMYDDQQDRRQGLTCFLRRL
jgi:hypothetical protein